MFLPDPRVKLSIVGSLRDREVLLAQFNLYVQKGGLKPDSFHYYMNMNGNEQVGGIGQCASDRHSDFRQYNAKFILIDTTNSSPRSPTRHLIC